MRAVHEMFATSAKGTEGALRDELRSLGVHGVKATRGGVRFRGTLDGGMRVCLWSRLASRVLLGLGEAAVLDAKSLYEGAAAIGWEDHIDHRGTFAVRATTRSEAVSHSGYAALKVKDAIVDRLRDRRGSRPNVNTRRPDVLVSVHVDKDRAAFYLDLSGEPLHRRGWRSSGGAAPLKESLAAAMLRLGGYDPELPFCDPMCGSGTLVIEAALIARKIAPGLRRGFGFESWPAMDRVLRAGWREIREEAKAASLPEAPASLLGYDRSEESVELAVRNARRAGVAADVRLATGDVRSPPALPRGCQVFTNPPYGERLGRRRLQLEGLYRKLGEALLGERRTGRVVMLAGNPALERALGEEPSERRELYNGPLRCNLLTWH